MMRRPIPPPSASMPRGQRGNTLLVVLLLLLVMTLLGLASLRGAMLEERMTASLLDRSLAFQAAEAALRQGESVALALPAPPPPPEDTSSPVCQNGICRHGNYEGLVAKWRFDDHAVPAKALPDNTLAVSKPGDVRYLVIHGGRAETTYGCSRILDARGNPRDPLCLAEIYRVEARYQAAGRAEVFLRSVVQVPVLASEPP